MNAEHIKVLFEIRAAYGHKPSHFTMEKAAIEAAIAALSAEGGAVAWQYRMLFGDGHVGAWHDCTKDFYDKHLGTEGHEFRELVPKAPAAAAMVDMVLVPREPTPAALKQLMSGEQRHRFNNGSKDVREEVLAHVRANFADFLAAQQEPAP